MLTLANVGQYGGGFSIAPQADPQDGWAELCLVWKVPVWQAAREAVAVFLKRRGSSRVRRFYRAQAVRVERPAPSLWHLDGEAWWAPGATVSVQMERASLRVLAGAGWKGRGR